MAQEEQRFILSLLGPFRLVAPDGRRIEIASKKGVALIAMLATSKDGERARAWLRDKLWSSREQEQAQASMRRELSNLRRALNGDAHNLLLCEHDRVRLNLGKIYIDTRQAAAGDETEGSRSAGAEFLEGLDIAGETEFEDWLREQRTVFGPKSSHSRNIHRPRQTSDGLPPFTSAEGGLPSSIVDVSRPAPGFGGRPAIAVLSFLNITGDEGNDYLAEGISEELIERLSRLRWLPVIGRSSSFSVGHEAENRRDIGRKLGAKYLLEGRLRQANQDFQLTVTLQDTESGYVLWSPRFKLPHPNLPGAIEELMSDLVAVLDSRIDHAEQVSAHAKPQSTLSVNELIWRGRWHLNKFTRRDSEIASDLFAQALGLDSNSPEAIIQATWCRCWSLWAQRGSEAEIMEMRKLAHRAIVADYDDSRGHMLAGIAEAWLRQPARAKASLERAIALNPSLTLAHAQLGDCLWLAGEPQKAIAPLQTALRLSPNDMHLFFTLGELAVTYCMLGRWSEAIEHAEQSLARRPAYWFSHMVKVNALVRTGNIPAAARAFRDLLAAKPKFALSYLNWIPFVDRKWNDYFREGMTIASTAEPAVREHPIVVH